MIALLFRAIAIVAAAIFYVVVTVVMFEVKLAKMGWRAVKQRKDLPVTQQRSHAAAGVGALLLPVLIIAGIVSTENSGGSNPSGPTPDVASMYVPPSHHHVHRHAKIAHPVATPHHRHHHYVVPAPVRAAKAHSVRVPAHSCTLTSTGNCIRGGEFCPASATGHNGYDIDGRRYVCRNGHWETP